MPLFPVTAPEAPETRSTPRPFVHSDVESWKAAATFNELAGGAVLFSLQFEDPMHFYRAREIELR